MADLVTPGETGAAIDSRSAGAAMEKASLPWIVDGVDLAGYYSAVDETALDGFRHATTTDLTVTIAAGEAYVNGWLVRDRTTDVTLPASATTRVYVGYDASAILGQDQAPAASENVIVGPESAFDPGDPRALLYEFTTDGTTVTASTDHRKLEQPLTLDPETDTVGINASSATVGGDPVATQTYADAAYSDDDARAAVTATTLPGANIRLPNDGGHPDGYQVGPNGYVNYSNLNRWATIYSLAEEGVSAGGWRFRNYWGAGDMFTVSQHTGDGWFRGGVEAHGSLIDARDTNGLVPKVLGSGESLPSDTVPGRLVYDPSREE